MVGGLESWGFLVFIHHWAWHGDAGMAQDGDSSDLESKD